MFIRKIYIENFGKLHKKNFSFTRGINLIYGDNESGKSTMHMFILCMLFGLERQRGRASKDDMYSRYQPWDNPAVYAGTMEIEFQGIHYRIERNFYKESRSFHLYNADTGMEFSDNSITKKNFLNNITKTLFENTCSISQGQIKTDGSLATQVQNYIANMGMTGTKQIKVNNALTELKKKRRELEKSGLPDLLKNLRDSVEYFEQQQKKQDALSQKIKEMEQSIHLSEKHMMEEEQQWKPLLQYVNRYSSIEAEYSFLQQLNRQWEQNRKRKEETLRLCEEAGAALKLTADHIIQSSILKFGSGFLCIAAGTFFLINYKTEQFISTAFYIFALVFFFFGLHYRERKKKKIKKSEMEHLQSEREQLLQEQDILRQQINIKRETIYEYASHITNNFYLDDMNMKDLREAVLHLKDELEEKRKNYINQLNELKMSLERLKWEWSRLEEELKDAFQIRQDLAEKEKEYKEMKNKVRALQIAEDYINAIARETHEELGKKLDSVLAGIVSKITGGKYTRVFADENLNIKLETNEKFVNMERLSRGTVDQIYFALRFSSGELLMPEEKMPIIIDESFGEFDDKRLERIFASVLAAEERQILLFSCQQRDKAVMDKAGISYHIIMMEEKPA